MSIWTAGKDLIKLLYHQKKDFYNELTLEDISDKDYEHAQKLYKHG